MTNPTMCKSILQEAEEIIYGDREQTYGHPGKNLTNIANLWGMYLAGKFGNGIGSIQAEDVANMMMLVKIARLINTPGHRDSLVDICGYAALVERIHAYQTEAQKDHFKPEGPSAGADGHSFCSDY